MAIYISQKSSTSFLINGWIVCNYSWIKLILKKNEVAQARGISRQGSKLVLISNTSKIIIPWDKGWERKGQK